MSKKLRFFIGMPEPEWDFDPKACCKERIPIGMKIRGFTWTSMGLTMNLDAACHDARWGFSWTSSGLPPNAYLMSHPRARLLLNVEGASTERLSDDPPSSEASPEIRRAFPRTLTGWNTYEGDFSWTSLGLRANAYPMPHPGARPFMNGKVHAQSACHVTRLWCVAWLDIHLHRIFQVC